MKEFDKNNFSGAIQYFNKSILKDPLDSASYYHRGLCFNQTDKSELACLDFKFATSLGMFEALQASYTYCGPVAEEEDLEFKGLIQPGLINNYDSDPSCIGGLDSIRYLVALQLKADPEFRRVYQKKKVHAVLDIDKDGSVTAIHLSDKESPFSKSVNNTLRSNLKWTPAYRNNEPVACSYLIHLVDTNFYRRAATRTYNEGVKQMQSGNLVEAFAFFNKALTFNPNDLDAYYNRGICYFKNGDTTSACNDWSLAVFSGYKNAEKLIRRVCDSLAIYNSDTLELKKPGIETDKIYTIVDSMPQFPGGQSMLFKFLQQNVRYPKVARENGIQGTVYITFVVTTSGDIDDVKILRGLSGGCSEEALEVVKLMPQWIPGYQDGKAVNVQYNMPINFTLK